MRYWVLFILLVMASSCEFPQKQDCKSISIDVYWKAKAKGYESRIATGTIEDNRAHRWVEYFKNGKWLVWDEAIWTVGKSPYTASELKYITYYTTPPRLLTDKIFIRPDNRPFCTDDK